MGKNSKARRDAKMKSVKKKQAQAQAQAQKKQFNGIDSSTISKLRDDYIKDWNITANHYYEKGYYKWMSAQISSYQNILEVGCGNGCSTKQLLDDGHFVISVDENPKCLDETEKHLISCGYTVKRIDREKILTSDRPSYQIEYSDIPGIQGDFDALLINGDISHDPKLYEFLDSYNIDAIICWLIGSHGTRILNQSVIDSGCTASAAHYRILTQNRVYEVADEILKKDGILHIIDRGTKLDDKQLNDTITCHKAQASVTRLVVQEDSIESLPYEEPTSENKMQMILTNQATGEVIQRNDFYFHSIKSIMP